MYRVNTYYSFKGLIELVDLGENSYGQWILYDNDVPKYHVDIFDKASVSNIELFRLLENKYETIEGIIAKINIRENTRLSLRHRPVLEVFKKSELLNLDLKPLPENWVSNISLCSF